MATPNDTMLTSLAVGAIGRGLVTPYQGMPLAVLGHRAETNGMADDFVHYKGPVAAGSADGYTLGLTATGALAPDTTHENGAGVLRFSVPVVADAASLETQRNLLELGTKAVQAVAAMQLENLTDVDVRFGLGTAGVVHGTADSSDMVEVRWNAAGAVATLRTRRNGGSVTTSTAPAALSARIAASAGALLLGIQAKADGSVAAVVSLNNGQTWDVIAALDGGHASLPIAGDPLALYVAAVSVVASTYADLDSWAYAVER